MKSRSDSAYDTCAESGLCVAKLILMARENNKVTITIYISTFFPLYKRNSLTLLLSSIRGSIL